jgi:hypothetical protein
MRVLTPAGVLDRPPVSVRVVRGVWWDGRSLSAGDVVRVSPTDAEMLLAAGKVVRAVSPPPAPAASVADEAEAAPVVRHREPVRRMRR